MTDLRSRFRSLDGIPVQDFWAEVESRAIARPAPRASSPSVLLIAAALVLAVVLGGAVLVGTGILPIPNPLENVGPSTSPTTSDVPGPSTSPSDGATDGSTWTATPGLVGGLRSGHTLTLLPDGRVLLAGDNGAGRLAQLFDPRTGSWVATSEMNQGRAGHTATLLADGTVLVTGGSDPGGVTSPEITVGSAEIFDPADGTWTATAPMLELRVGHTATLLADGTVLVTGGSDARSVGENGTGREIALPTAEIYDPATRAWTAAASMVSARSGHTATLVGDGTALVVGGVIGLPGEEDAEVFDPVTGTWQAVASMAETRSGHVTTLLPSGRVLVSGGGFPLSRTAEIFDPLSRTWTTTTPMNEGRSGFTATTLPNGRVLVTGSGDGAYSGSPTAELYDPARETWTFTTNMLSPHGWHEAIGLDDGRVLVVGGYGTSSPPEPANGSDPVGEIYDPEAD